MNLDLAHFVSVIPSLNLTVLKSECLWNLEIERNRNSVRVLLSLLSEKGRVSRLIKMAVSMVCRSALRLLDQI